MKTNTFIILLVLTMLKTQAQDYLISFAGTGATTEVDIVKVDNLTSGATVTLNGGDILHLISATGIGSLNLDNGTMQIYPNPMAEQSILTFVAPENGDAVIGIVNLSGKTVYQINVYLSQGENSFRISGINRGMYFVKVTGKNYDYSIKLISQSNLQGVAGIEYVSSGKNTTGNPLKSTAATVDMPYTSGDQLLFKGVSGIYSTIVTDVPTSSKTITFNFAECTDNDNNNYAIVEIGTRTWMAENLKVGVRIDGNQDPTNNGIIEKYCVNDDVNNCNTFGGLYQWNEMMQYVTTEGTKGICPTGWHIPTDVEWTVLTTFLGGESIAGGKMKSTGTIEAGTGLWYEPNTGATNSSGFTVFPGGDRDANGFFYNLSYYAFFWSSSQVDATNAWRRNILYNIESVQKSSYDKTGGFSVRCIQD